VGAWRNYHYYRSEKRSNIFEYETKSAVEIDRVASMEEDGSFGIYIVKKKFEIFPSPAGMSLPNSPWAGIMTS
jgi:hypothetical protein